MKWKTYFHCSRGCKFSVLLLCLQQWCGQASIHPVVLPNRNSRAHTDWWQIKGKKWIKCLSKMLGYYELAFLIFCTGDILTCHGHNINYGSVPCVCPKKRFQWASLHNTREGQAQTLLFPLLFVHVIIELLCYFKSKFKWFQVFFL